MAFFKDYQTGRMIAVAYSDPLDGIMGDLIVDGIPYDTATFMPKMGKNVVNIHDTSSSDVDMATAYYDVDYIGKLAHLCGDANYYILGACFGGNYPSCQRHWLSNRTATADVYKQARMTRMDQLGRDWLEDPVTTMTYDASTQCVYTSHAYTHRAGTNYVYDVSSNKPFGNSQVFYNNPTAGEMFVQWGLQDAGLVGVAMTGETTKNIEYVVINQYSRHAQLKQNTHDTLYQPSTSERVQTCKLTTLDNGDIVYFIKHGINYKVCRIENSTNSNVIEYSITGTSSREPIPSNVVRHNDSNESNAALKISYIPRISNTTYWTGNAPLLVEMDTATGDVTVTACTLNSYVGNTLDAYGIHDAAFFSTSLDARIISTGQGLTDQKYLVSFTTAASHDDQGSDATFSDAAERIILVHEINASNKSIVNLRKVLDWNSLLTTSTVNSGYTQPAAAKVPWCIAPLNPEHSLMMVFCLNTTHVLKFDAANYTFDEIWYDENTIFTAAMWFPTGKVLTSEWDERFREGAGVGAIDSYRQAMQIWSEDMIYKLDILPDTQYAAYSGTNITSDVTFNAYDANNTRKAVSIKVRIEGPAQFDNSSAEKTFTLSSSADTVETVTITGDGQIEFEVLEIQSI